MLSEQKILEIEQDLIKLTCDNCRCDRCEPLYSIKQAIELVLDRGGESAKLGQLIRKGAAEITPEIEADMKKRAAAAAKFDEFAQGLVDALKGAITKTFGSPAASEAKPQTESAEPSK